MGPPTCLSRPPTRTPPSQSNEEGLVLISEALKAAGCEGKVKIAMDCAASEFYGALRCRGAGRRRLLLTEQRAAARGRGVKWDGRGADG